MSLKVVGAGLGRTGTFSLKLGLERLLDAPCYHMYEVFQHMDHVAEWHAAARGETVDWQALMSGYAAAVDWPASAFWPELLAANPDAKVVLSVRDPESWWNSAHETIFPSIEMMNEGETAAWYAMVNAVMAARFTPNLTSKEASIEAFEKHYEKARREIPADRLVVWHASEGWPKLCEALNVPIPDEPFPVSNTKKEFLERVAERSHSH